MNGIKLENWNHFLPQGHRQVKNKSLKDQLNLQYPSSVVYNYAQWKKVGDLWRLP